MNHQPPNSDFPVELLAAYVDGELSPCQRAYVEAWLREHPEVAGELADQTALSVRNGMFQTQIEPPLPTAEAWNECLEHIAEAVAPLPKKREIVPRKRKLVWGSSLVAGIAAAILLIVFWRGSSPSPSSPVRETVAVNQPKQPELPAEVFSVARDEDVEVIRLPAPAQHLLVVGKPPMDDAPIVLATATDVEVFSYGPDDAGSWPDVVSVAGPDAPMIVTAPRRR